MSWKNQFRRRIDRFESPPGRGNGLSVSIKIRVTSGCYHREHSPEAYRIIDKYMPAHRDATIRYSFQEHESGPELLVYLALGAAGLTLAKSIVDLVTAIIKARSEGIKRGDRPRDPLEIIVRGFDKNGKLREETVLRCDPKDNVSREVIGKALNNGIKFIADDIDDSESKG